VISVAAPNDFEAWRVIARSLLARGLPPAGIVWEPAAQRALWENWQVEEPSPEEPADSPANVANVRIPPRFLELARLVAAHLAPERWAVLYRVLWRLSHGERHLLQLASDVDTHALEMWEKAVRRELHKMTAFVRFRAIRDEGAGGREHFIAWYEPVHDVVALGAPFFVRRFTSMQWSILSPRRCVHWDGATLRESPGVSRDQAPNDDALEALWRTYYASIFNPARLKIDAMLREMPRRYWKNLPETDLIEQLITDASSRTETMIEASREKQRPLL
jgi:uracil-DNA glycosylase